MKLIEIKKQGLHLTQHLLSSPSGSLLNKIVWSYHYHLQKKFTDIFSVYRERSDLVKRLNVLLQNNWYLTKNTCLAYTCLPIHPITQLMLGIAEWIAKETNHINGIMHFFMPGLELESIQDGYPDLTLSELQSSKAITQILQTHILSDDATFLIPIRLLANLPLSDMSNLANPYFNYQRMSASQAHINQAELQRLYSHHLSTQNFYDCLKNYQDILNQQNHLLGQLRKLCRGLNMGSRYGEGSELQAGGSAYASIIEFSNFYNRLFSKVIYQYPELPVDLSELNQSYLWVNHTELYYIQANEAIEIKLHDNKSFNKALKNLLGNEWRMALLNPQDLYYFIEKNSDFKTIDPSISPYLQQDIRNLIDYVTNPKVNVVATARADTCVATIRQAIITHITAQEEQLASFKLIESSPEDIDKMRQKARTAQLELLKLLNDKTYFHGQDSLENYGRLIRKMDIEYEITSISELTSLLNLNPKNFQSIFKQEALRQQSSLLFANLDALLVFMMEISADKLSMLISNLKVELTTHFLSHLGAWCYIFAILDTERAAVIVNLCAQNILTKPENLIVLANNISLGSFQMICNSQKELLLSLFNAQSCLKLLKEVDSSAHRLFWVDCFLDDIKDKFNSIETFTQLSPYLTPEQINSVYETNCTKLIYDVKDLTDLHLLMSPHTKPYHLWIFEQQLEKLSSYVTHHSELQLLLKLTPDPFFAEICRRLNLKLVEYLKKHQHLLQILQSISPEKQIQFSHHFQVPILKLIILENNIGELLSYSDLLKQPLFYRNLYNQLLLATDEKACYAFIISLALDEDYIKRDFDQLFLQKARLTFFEKPIHPEQIISTILKFPEQEIRKIFLACALEWNNHKDIRKQNLKTYIHELQAQPNMKKN